MHLLGVLQNGSYARPAAINSRGQVVGFSSIQGISGYRAFITGPNGKGIRDLGLPEEYNMATGINDSGQVTGTTFEVYGYPPGNRRQFNNGRKRVQPSKPAYLTRCPGRGQRGFADQ